MEKEKHPTKKTQRTPNQKIPIPKHFPSFFRVFFLKRKPEININLALIKPGIDPEYSSRQKKKKKN